jgi:serine/threonine-protein kinase mTOR
VSAIEQDLVEGAYFRAVLALHADNFERTAYHIDLARRLLDNTFAALVAESYTRAYSHMVRTV